MRSIASRGIGSGRYARTILRRARICDSSTAADYGTALRAKRARAKLARSLPVDRRFTAVRIGHASRGRLASVRLRVSRLRLAYASACAFAWLPRYSHSIVAGGLLLRSRATRLTPGISLMIRLEIVSNRS